MRSPRGVTAAAVFLSAVPVTFLYQAIAGTGAEVVIHVALALGSFLMAFAVFDFQTAKWIAWCGSLSIGVLGAIFLLQGLSELMQNATLTHAAYQVLGQRIEAWMGYVFLLWCAAVLLCDSQGKTRFLGFIALLTVASVEVFAQAPTLKILSLLLFVWLLLESLKPLGSIMAFRPR